MNREDIIRIWRNTSPGTVITEEGLRICEAIAAAQPAVPLTDEQITALRKSVNPNFSFEQGALLFARAIEASHGITAAPEQKIPENCGTGHCSCIECFKSK